MLKAFASVLALGAACVSAGRFQDFALDRYGIPEFKRATPENLGARDTKYQFLNNQTQPYFVESLPLVTVPLGEMYAGSVPIDMNDPTRTLFFIFYPTINEPVEEITIWLNGGPGCSSLEGFFQENGPIIWPPGTYAPYINPYSWVNLTNMLWVEQPVGTGFTQGNASATSEEDIAADFISFFKNWETIFGIQNHKIYVTGESYAGRYVPYISAAMLDQKDETHFNLSGALMYDPCIGEFDGIQEGYPAVPFVQANANLFNFNESFMAELESLHQSCGYASYIEKYLAFPPAGVQPPSFFNYTSEANCDVFDMINEAAFQVNPCFNIYEISQMCPIAWDVLGFPTELVFESPGSFIYFNRSDVKTALHAPQDITWAECSGPVFFGNGPYGPGSGGPEGEGDLSPDPIQGVLPQVIEATNRVIVGNGDFDMIIITNGTLMSIQNMTWNGQLGFQQQPTTPINITIPDILYEDIFCEPENAGICGDDNPIQGIMGVQHYERGLMWVETYQSGHMQPQFQPRVSYRHMQWLLGRVQGDVL